MRILYIDIDSLRPDHLGCYGYQRNTSPHIDALAEKGVRFTNCYASDTPCLPSRTALLTGQFGFKTGVLNHGGEASYLREPNMGGKHNAASKSLPYALMEKGYHTCFISPFIQRHSAWHTYAGFREVHDTGKHGHEVASETNTWALPWIQNNAQKEDWFLHLNYWDPHRPYRTPESYGNPFKDDPAPAWPDQDTLDRQMASYGPRSASEPIDFRYNCDPKITSREVSEVKSRKDFKTWIDGYDTGIRYVDDHIGQLIAELDAQGVLEDTAIVISADHGEMQGEFNVYGDHHCADQATAGIPMIVHWPGVTKPSVQDGLIYGLDLAPTLTELTESQPSANWDGRSFKAALEGEPFEGREYLVLSQGLWTAQRSVRVGDYLMIRTYHPGLKPLPDLMLFDVKNDPHQTKDLSQQRPEVVYRCSHLMGEWIADLTSRPERYTDPLNTVILSGGPRCVSNRRDKYAAWLVEQGKPEASAEVLARNPN